MYCKNCGKEIANEAYVCVHCGVRAGAGNAYCPNCGQETLPEAVACLNCGVPLGNQTFRNTQGKSKLAAGLLGILLGSFGVHNFYLGYTGKAIAQLLITCLSCGTLSLVSGIWGMIEGILILTGSIATDSNGVPLVD